LIGHDPFTALEQWLRSAEKVAVQLLSHSWIWLVYALRFHQN